MASAALRDELTCPICLSIYTDPVTLPCGHNFCRLCIVIDLDSQEGSGTCKCPECRAKFQERPALERNRKLQNIADRFRSTHPDQEEVNIPCTYCIQSPVPAVKTCVHCEASLCESHLRVHSKSEEHVMVEPTTSLGNRKCSVHKKVLEYYCCEDAACICVSCSLAGKHRGHQVETLNEASEKKKKTLRLIWWKLTSRIQEAEKGVQNLQRLMRQVQEKAAGVTGEVTSLIRNIREQLNALEKRVLSEISRQEEQVSRRVSDLIHQLEIKKEELTRKMGDIKKLCDTTDPLTVLQGRVSDNDGDFANPVGTDAEPVHSVGDLDLGLISATLHGGFFDIMTTARSPSNIAQTSDLFLDINSAGNHLNLSNDLKMVSCSRENKRRPKTPERFGDHFPCVVNTRRFSSGRHYWEVEVSESAEWEVDMAYANISRTSIENQIKCWGVARFKHLTVAENTAGIYLSDGICCQRLGIFLDYEAGRLSFYNVHDTIKHLGTFNVTFTEPLVFLFTVCDGGWVRFRS